MATTALSFGRTTLKFYSKEEQNKTWKEFEDYDRLHKSPNHIKYTNDREELPYQVLSEETISYDNYIKVIKANGKTVKVKFNTLNENDKINKAVKKLFI